MEIESLLRFAEVPFCFNRNSFIFCRFPLHLSLKLYMCGIPSKDNPKRFGGEDTLEKWLSHKLHFLSIPLVPKSISGYINIYWKLSPFYLSLRLVFTCSIPLTRRGPLSFSLTGDTLSLPPDGQIGFLSEGWEEGFVADHPITGWIQLGVGEGPSWQSSLGGEWEGGLGISFCHHGNRAISFHCPHQTTPSPILQPHSMISWVITEPHINLW